jgi:type IV pilus assembly protein PilM
MAIQPGVWGIDIGQCALKAIRLQEIDGAIQATAFDYVEHPKILSQPDADPDQLTHEALKTFLSRNTLRGDVVVISVPGQSGLARFVKLPPVEEKKISDIVRFEAKQQIPFNLEEVVWDYQKIGQGTVTDGFAMETEIGLFAMKRDMVNRYLQHFKDVNVEVHIVQMAPLALCNFVAYDLLGKGAGPAGEEGVPEEDRHTCIVALDIGADSSNLIITDGEKIIWQRPIPLGGNHFTRALTKDLKLTFAKAEHLKRNATKSPDLKKILASLKPVLNDFVSEVQRSLAFFTNTHRDAQVEYMMGLGNAFRLPGLQRFLAEKLQLDVKKLGKMERMTGDAVVAQQVYTENVLSFAVAYGLALQGLKRSRLITNLLPGEIRIERLVRAKKPWAVSAAAALLLGGGAFLLSYYLEDRPYWDKRVQDAMEKSKSAVSNAKSAQSKFDQTKTAAINEEKAVKSIVAGQMERSNWLQLLKFIDDAVPRPDGSNLTADMKKFYWDAPVDPSRPDKFVAMTGRRAYQEFNKRETGALMGVKDESVDELGAGINDLVQFNIEAIDCRFSDDLVGLHTALRSIVDTSDAWRPKEQFNKPPEGKGWVIELRGYTFHHKGRVFIMETLLENLARYGIPPADAAPAEAPKPDKATTPVAGDKGPAGPPGKDSAAPKGSEKAATAPGGASAPAPAGTKGGNPPPPPGGAKTTPPVSPAAPPAPVPAAPGTQPAKPGELPDKGPVLNRVSHVVLLATSGAETSSTNTFQLITGGKLSGLATNKGAPAAPAGQPGQTAPNMPGMQERIQGGPGGGDGWSPLVSLNPSGSSSGNPASKGAEKLHHRTEFIVLFIWKEPTPSDDLRDMGSAPGASLKR